MNSHNDLKSDNSESLIKENDRIDTNMNETLHNGDVRSRIGLLNIHTLLQDNE